MRIVQGYPPNYEDIKKAFNPPEEVIFTYGDTCYAPKSAYLRPDLFVHEEIHTKQQKNPKKWWKEYIKDPKFRLEQEAEAYAGQYRYFCGKIKDRNEQAKFLHLIASDLSGPVYGNIASYEEAKKKITNDAYKSTK